jgi:hypothetical protein
MFIARPTSVPGNRLVRLRITRQPSGSVDGIRLDDFIVGFVYDIGTTLGSYLLAQGLAEPADNDATGLVPPLIEIRFSVIQPATVVEPLHSAAQATPESSVVEPLSEAADSARPQRPKRGPAEPSTA